MNGADSYSNNLTKLQHVGNFSHDTGEVRSGWGRGEGGSTTEEQNGAVNQPTNKRSCGIGNFTFLCTTDFSKYSKTVGIHI